MNRIVVLGGTGVFGRMAVAELKRLGVTPVVAARRPPAELQLDAENPSSVRGALRPGDVVVDTAGPYQRRTTCLAEAAIEMGFHVVDIADAIGYVDRVRALNVGESQAKLLTSCSTGAAVTGAAIAWSGITDPVRLTALVIPSTRHTAAGGTAASLMASLGRPITCLIDGKRVERRGFSEPRDFPSPLGTRKGWRYESADASMLPLSHPSLRTVEWFVDPNVPGLGTMLDLVSRSSGLSRISEQVTPHALPLIRMGGRDDGGVVCEVEDGSGRVARVSVTEKQTAYRLAVVPPSMAARAVAEGEVDGTGVIPPHRQLDPEVLRQQLLREGFTITID